MTRGKTPIIVLVALVIGFGAGFVLRPAIAPVRQDAVGASPAPASSAAAGPRSKQYFAAHLNEAQQAMEQCADGSLRGDECFNAEMAVTEANGRARHKRFFGN